MRSTMQTCKNFTILVQYASSKKALFSPQVGGVGVGIGGRSYGLATLLVHRCVRSDTSKQPALASRALQLGMLQVACPFAVSIILSLACRGISWGSGWTDDLWDSFRRSICSIKNCFILFVYPSFLLGGPLSRKTLLFV